MIDRKFNDIFSPESLFNWLYHELDTPHTRKAYKIHDKSGTRSSNYFRKLISKINKIVEDDSWW